MTILKAFEDPKVFGWYFKRRHTWENWRVFLKAVYGIRMTAKEKEIFKKYTGRETIPEAGFSEFYAIVGRRGGKSTIVSLVAVYEAIFGNWEKYLAPGERASIFIMATAKQQAKIVFGYCRAFLKNYEHMIVKEGAESISLNNRIDLIIQAANFRGLRGFATAAVILDELAFFRSEEYANPAEEIVNALIPSFLPGAKLIGISTPYGKFGYLFEMYKEHFARDASDVLIWKAPTLAMNPAVNRAAMRRARRKDPTAAKTEYEAEFREDLSTYLSNDEVEQLTDHEVSIRPPEEGKKYFAFVDVSGGKDDSLAMAIAHLEGQEVWVDYIYEEIPPYRVKDTVQHCCEMMKHYGIWEVVGDRYGGEFSSQIFEEHGIQYIVSELDKNHIYLEFQTIANLRRVRLLDNRRLRYQLVILERKAGRMGRDTVQHPPGAHDDVANVVAGAVVTAYKYLVSHPSEEELRARVPRLVHKGESITYRSAWQKILDQAEKEMQERLARRKKDEVAG